MDPNACIRELFSALATGDTDTARERAIALADWTADGGFPPQPFTIPQSAVHGICTTLALVLPDDE